MIIRRFSLFLLLSWSAISLCMQHNPQAGQPMVVTFQKGPSQEEIDLFVRSLNFNVVTRFLGTYPKHIDVYSSWEQTAFGNAIYNYLYNGQAKSYYIAQQLLKRGARQDVIIQLGSLYYTIPQMIQYYKNVCTADNDMQQRVAYAEALLNNPSINVAPENLPHYQDKNDQNECDINWNKWLPYLITAGIIGGIALILMAPQEKQQQSAAGQQ